MLQINILINKLGFMIDRQSFLLKILIFIFIQFLFLKTTYADVIKKYNIFFKNVGLIIIIFKIRIQIIFCYRNHIFYIINIFWF